MHDVSVRQGRPLAACNLCPFQCISLKFRELLIARSCHDFLQVHIDLLTGRRPHATSSHGCSMARLPDVLVSDRATRFTGAIWTGPARGNASLIFGSPHHHSTTRKAERVNGVVANVWRSSASERADDWPKILRLVEFTINDSASHLGTGYTLFYPDRYQNLRSPLTPSAAPDFAGSGEEAAPLLGLVTVSASGVV